MDGDYNPKVEISSMNKIQNIVSLGKVEKNHLGQKGRLQSKKKTQQKRRAQNLNGIHQKKKHLNGTKEKQNSNRVCLHVQQNIVSCLCLLISRPFSTFIIPFYPLFLMIKNAFRSNLNVW